MSLINDVYYLIMRCVVRSPDFTFDDLPKYLTASKLLHRSTLRALTDDLRSESMLFISSASSNVIYSPYEERIKSDGVATGKRAMLTYKHISISFLYATATTAISFKRPMDVGFVSLMATLDSNGVKTLMKSRDTTYINVLTRDMPQYIHALEFIRNTYPEIYLVPLPSNEGSP